MKRTLVALALLVAVGCTKVEFPPDSSRSSSPTAPSSPAATAVRIEFRVNGNSTSVRVRYSNPQDGLTQVVTTLPYVTSITTTDASLFVSLEATPLNYSALTLYPFLSVQILANGSLFREATSNEFLLQPLSISGTWRR